MSHSNYKNIYEGYLDNTGYNNRRVAERYATPTPLKNCGSIGKLISESSCITDLPEEGERISPPYKERIYEFNMTGLQGTNWEDSLIIYPNTVCKYPGFPIDLGNDLNEGSLNAITDKGWERGIVMRYYNDGEDTKYTIAYRNQDQKVCPRPTPPPTTTKKPAPTTQKPTTTTQKPTTTTQKPTTTTKKPTTTPAKSENGNVCWNSGDCKSNCCGKLTDNNYWGVMGSKSLCVLTAQDKCVDPTYGTCGCK